MVEEEEKKGRAVRFEIEVRELENGVMVEIDSDRFNYESGSDKQYFCKDGEEILTILNKYLGDYAVSTKGTTT